MAAKREEEAVVRTYKDLFEVVKGLDHYSPLLRHGHESIVGRDELVRNVMQAVQESEEPLSGVIWNTSGQDKIKFYLPSSYRETQRQRQSTRDLCRNLDIVRRDMAVLNLLGGTSSYEVYKEWEELLASFGCTVLPCDGASADDYIFRTAQRFKASCIAATPARLVQFAWYLGTEGHRLPMPNIILYGDVVRECHLRTFNAVFSERSHGKELKPRIASCYGTAELGIIGFSPHQLHDPRTICYDAKIFQMDVAECSPDEIPPSVDERWAEVFEHQRKFPMVGWKGKMMKGDPPVWVAEDGVTEQRRDAVPLPGPEWGQWAFDGEWQPSDTWNYAWTWEGPWMTEEEIASTPDPSGKKEKTAKRRRSWKIKMVKIGESKGTGRLLCSVLCRSRWPMFRYDTGDMATLRKPVMYGGDPYHAFRLSGNPPGAFGLQGGVPIWTSEFSPAMRDFCEYQVRVELREHEAGTTDVVTCLVVPRPSQGHRKVGDLGEAASKRIIAELRGVLESLRDDALPEFVLEIRQVTPGELSCAEASLRVRRLLECRGGSAPPLRKRARSKVLRRRGLSQVNPGSPGDDGGASPKAAPAPGSPRNVRFADATED